MKNSKIINLPYTVWSAKTDLPQGDQILLDAAHEALKKSYSPYSEFRVGCAIRLASGTILSGANFENASYPLCLCAERVVLATAAASHPNEQIESMAITLFYKGEVVQKVAAPCGACRQVILETIQKQGETIRLLCTAEDGHVIDINDARSLLPFGFGKSHLLGD